MRPGRAVHPDRRRAALRGAHGRAARPLERERPGEDRAARRGISSTATSTTSISRATRSTPAATYERWARRLTKGSEPVVYAHVATEAAAPGQLALQYWFFYPFNDFNNTHEGDWEMIQLLFDADDAEEALGKDPVAVGYSSHEGAERADWDDDKLERVDGTHPVVYPAAGSHAEQVHRRALPRQLRRGGCRLRRHPRAARRAAALGDDDPVRSRRGGRGPPVDHLRGTLGRAPEGVLQRADRAEPQDAVDGADHLVGGLAEPELRGADRRHLRHERDRSLLQRRRRGLEGTHAARPQPLAAAAPPHGAGRARRLRNREGDLDAGRTAPARTPPRMGSDPRRLGPHVREASAPLPRARPPVPADRRRHHAPAVADLRAARPRRSVHRGGGGWRRVPGARGRHDADAPRVHVRPGGDGVRARRARRRPPGRPARGVPPRPRADPAAPRCDRDRGVRRGSC